MAWLLSFLRSLFSKRRRFTPPPTHQLDAAPLETPAVAQEPAPAAVPPAAVPLVDRAAITEPEPVVVEDVGLEAEAAPAEHAAPLLDPPPPVGVEIEAEQEEEAAQAAADPLEDDAELLEDEEPEDLDGEDDPSAPDPFISPVRPQIEIVATDALAGLRAQARATALSGEHRIHVSEAAGPGSLAEALGQLLQQGRVTVEFHDEDEEDPYLLYRPVTPPA